MEHVYKTSFSRFPLHNQYPLSVQPSAIVVVHILRLHTFRPSSTTSSKLQKMASVTPSTVQLSSLQSPDELALLDGIDKLRSQGLNHHIQLPQLIVCGDQSSGKSSVLEAISRIPFSTKDSLCTRFATEVILRRSTTSNVLVSIVPSQTRTESECTRISQFRATLTRFEDFPTVMEKAAEAMGLDSESSGAFSDDILRVEISGPDRPQLTIVDLPGLIHSENKKQTTEDVELIRAIVCRYMENRRSIILAIVSAKNDYANQIVLNLAKKYDPRGHRTLGIITKPDTIPAGSDSEAAFASLARNEDVEFRLGWHVIRNRSYEERAATLDFRDQVESEFFTKGIWSYFPRTLVGIGSLRPRLSKVLLDQIKTELPGVKEEIEQKLKDCRSRLDKLGPSRGNLEEQRSYLLAISQNFKTLTKAAIDGSYDDGFFGDSGQDEEYSKRFRAVVQNHHLKFKALVSQRGHYWTISEEEIDDDGLPDSAENARTTRLISRPAMIDHVLSLLQRNRGRELPGMYNPMIVSTLR